MTSPARTLGSGVTSNKPSWSEGGTVKHRIHPGPPPCGQSVQARFVFTKSTIEGREAKSIPYHSGAASDHWQPRNGQVLPLIQTDSACSPS
jgi:hypothetical protein